MNNSETDRSGRQTHLRTLCRVAQLSNALAKQLTGPARIMAYRIKAEACSSLILHGGARVNGVRHDGIVALDILVNPSTRLHIRRSHLNREARQIVGREASVAPGVSSIAQRYGGRGLPALVRGVRVIRKEVL
jgi:hypothetical protein